MKNMWRYIREIGSSMKDFMKMIWKKESVKFILGMATGEETLRMDSQMERECIFVIRRINLFVDNGGRGNYNKEDDDY